jgi:hypothetical protein
MGDWFQTLVFRSIAEPDAARIGDLLRDFLWAREIIAGEPSPEPVLGDVGYHPGAAALSVCETGKWAPFLDLLTNGVEIAVGRRIFCEYDGAEFFATCSRCESRFDMMAHEPAMDALGEFDLGEDGAFPCPNCGHASSLVDWNTEGVAGGFLGLKFWNWWPLKAPFKDELKRLSGSEILVIQGKL